MKRKLKMIILPVLFIAVILSGCSSEFPGEEKIKYEIKDGEAHVREVPDKSTVTEIVIPDETDGVPVTVIKDFASVNLENVEKITIGKNVKEIGTWAFENNSNLKEFEVSEENSYFCDADGVLFTKDMKTLLFYPAGKDIGTGGDEEFSTYEIPSGIETVSTKAFYKCQKIKNITIPDTVKIIEEKAFFRCSSLENITLSEGLTFIGKDAFSYCGKFTEISIPSTVKEIETYAFYNCPSLLSVNCLAKESDMVLGDKWYPTNNGKNISELKITFAG